MNNIRDEYEALSWKKDVSTVAGVMVTVVSVPVMGYFSVLLAMVWLILLLAGITRLSNYWEDRLVRVLCSGCRRGGAVFAEPGQWLCPTHRATWLRIAAQERCLELADVDMAAVAAVIRTPRGRPLVV